MPKLISKKLDHAKSLLKMKLMATEFTRRYTNSKLVSHMHQQSYTFLEYQGKCKVTATTTIQYCICGPKLCKYDENRNYFHP